MKVPRVALRAPRVQMQGVPTQPMPLHRRGGQHRRCACAARNPKGARGLRPLAAFLVVDDDQASPSSSCLASERRSLPRGPRDFHHGLLVPCLRSCRCDFGRLLAVSLVAPARKTPGFPALRASLTTKIHPEFPTTTSRTVH